MFELVCICLMHCGLREVGGGGGGGGERDKVQLLPSSFYGQSDGAEQSHAYSPLRNKYYMFLAI